VTSSSSSCKNEQVVGPIAGLLACRSFDVPKRGDCDSDVRSSKCFNIGETKAVADGAKKDNPPLAVVRTSRFLSLVKCESLSGLSGSSMIKGTRVPDDVEWYLTQSRWE
jgi:hypothetical protein